MRKLFLLIFCIPFFTYSQNSDYLNTFQRKYVVFPDCDESEDLQKCFDNKLSDFVAKNINTDDFSFIKENKKSDTIKLSASLYFDTKGNLDREDSRISFYHGKNRKELNSILESFPQVKPPLDENGNGVNQLVTSLIGFTLEDTNLKPIFNYETCEVPFSIIENVPIYKGCDSTLLDNIGLKKCMSEKIQEHIARNFNLRKASKGLPKGIVRIYVTFNVDNHGKISKIKVKSPSKKTKQETIRVLSSIPKFDRPGIQRGKPVTVPYSLPIIYKVE